MSIAYSLYENYLTSDPDDYIARVHAMKTADIDHIIEVMIKRGSTVVKADIVSVLTDYTSVIEDLLLEGYNVHTPLCNFGATIKGNFNGKEDSFDKSRHIVLGTANPGLTLKNAIKNRATVEKTSRPRAVPLLDDLHDMDSETRNGVLVPGALVKLTGSRLKFDKADVNQGIFFIDTDGNETRVASLARNKPADLIFNVPELTPGDYNLVVRVLFNEDDIREGVLPSVLNVPA